MDLQTGDDGTSHYGVATEPHEFKRRMEFLALQVFDYLVCNGCVVFLKNDGQFDGWESVGAFKIVGSDIVGELD